MQNNEAPKVEIKTVGWIDPRVLDLKKGATPSVNIGLATIAGNKIVNAHEKKLTERISKFFK
jgi:hypothetical protein